MILTNILVGLFIIYLLYFILVQFGGFDLLGWNLLLLSDIFLYLWLITFFLFSSYTLFSSSHYEFLCKLIRKRRTEEEALLNSE